MATTVTRYVNPASSAGGDGTTNATSGANRAYTSLSAALTAENATRANLVSADEVLEIICETDGTADSTTVAASTWTTDATRYVSIKTSSGHRHAGVWNTAKYRLAPSANFVPAFDSTIGFLRVEGLQIENTSANPTYTMRCDPGSGPTAGTVYISNCLMRDSSTAGLEIKDGTYYVRNCAIYQNTGIGLNMPFGNGGGTFNIDNCTIIASGTNAVSVGSSSNTVTLRNVYAAGSATADYSSNIDTLTTCASEDGSQSTTTVAYSTSSGAYFTNITASTEDFHIGTSSSLKDAGTDLSGSFTDDFDSVARSGTWDIGADEYVSAGGTAVPVFLHNLRQQGIA